MVVIAFRALESALSAVDEPPADVPSSPRYHYFCVAAHVASLIATASLQVTIAVHVIGSHAMLHPQEIVCNNCIPVALYTFLDKRGVSMQHD